MSRACATALALLLIGCGGRYGGSAPAKPKAPPAGGIAGAALPYDVLDARSGRQVEPAAFWTQLHAARAVCVGEDHSNPHHHWVQLEIVRQLGKQRPTDEKLALGLEMVQRPFQGVLDDYAAKRIDAKALQTRAGWEERWGYDFGFYGPTIDAALAAGGVVLALNAPRELTKKVVRKGLESLTPDERKQVPELVLDDANHRAWFDALMEGMGGAGGHAHRKQPASTEEPAETKDLPQPAEMPSAERIYTVQVIWDETMADTTAKWLAANPNGRAVILAGNGHCHDSAIVNRLKRRGVRDAVSVRAVFDKDGEVAEALAKPNNDFLVVLHVAK
ncbi:MAG: ChaN family lipoprotein [Kofleriaceae bacterium]|nr:ChaN family lipoprotein [Kofleriaceae bacterium]